MIKKFKKASKETQKGAIKEIIVIALLIVIALICAFTIYNRWHKEIEKTPKEPPILNTQGTVWEHKDTDTYQIGDLSTLNGGGDIRAIPPTENIEYVEPIEELETNIESNYYKDYIYTMESNNDPYALNEESGAVGLCQVNPNFHDIPQEYYNNVDVQDQFCTNYMLSRYGTWENAYNFHVANGWW